MALTPALTPTPTQPNPDPNPNPDQVESALIAVDPLIEGLPYIDWSVSGDDPERVLGARLGSAGGGVGVGAGSAVAQTVPDDYASAWPVRNLLIPTDGSFAWWPAHSHDSVAHWRATQPDGVSAAFSEELWAQVEARVAKRRLPIGCPAQRHTLAADPWPSAPVTRGLRA